jgi:hypothetical protein
MSVSEKQSGKDGAGLDAARHRESARRKLYLAGEFYSVLAEAAADGFRAFRDQMAAERVTERGFPHSLVLGITQGHTTFVERAARATAELLDPAKE